MPRTPIRASMLLLLLVGLLTPALAAPGAPGFVTSTPSDADPWEIALSYLRGINGLGLLAEDVDAIQMTDRYVSKHNGLTHIYVRQVLEGVPMANATLGIHIAPDGRILHVAGRLVPELARSVNRLVPPVPADEAVLRAADHLGLQANGRLLARECSGGPAVEVVFDPAGLSLDDIRAKLRLFSPGNGGSGPVRLAWELDLRTLDHQDWWKIWIDAETGDILGKATRRSTCRRSAADRPSWRSARQIRATPASSTATTSPAPRRAASSAWWWAAPRARSLPRGARPTWGSRARGSAAAGRPTPMATSPCARRSPGAWPAAPSAPRRWTRRPPAATFRTWT